MTAQIPAANTSAASVPATNTPAAQRSTGKNSAKNDAHDRLTIAEAGELATLDRVFPRLPQATAALLGPGDDAAVMRAGDGRFVVTTDMMIHGPDFRLAWSSAHDLGWKAAASNLADVAAMGATPTGLVVALAVPETTPVTQLEEFADGLREACEALAPGCGVVGGDLSVSDTFTIAVTAFGDLEGRAPVMRSGARPGDVVAVAGLLGAAARGLQLLFDNALNADGEPDTARAGALRDLHPQLVRAQLAPSPPISSGVTAALAGATAMLDISDGLALDAGRIAQASAVSIDFDSAALGVDAQSALAGGEDHSLLATFPHSSAVPAEFRVIGRVIEQDSGSAAAPIPGMQSRVTVDGENVDISGWDPYSGWDGQSG